MSESDGYTLGTVTVTKTLTDDDVILDVIAADPDGDELPLIDALGMFELGKDTLIRQRMDEDE